MKGMCRLEAHCIYGGEYRECPVRAGSGYGWEGRGRVLRRPSSVPLPETADGNRAESGAEGHGRLAVVQHRPAREPGPGRRREPAKAAEVFGACGSARLHFHAGDPVRAAFEDDASLGPVPVPKVKEPCRRIVPACLPSKLLEHECLEKVSEEPAVGHESVGVDAKRSAGDSGIPQMQFRPLHGTAHEVDVPGGQTFKQEHPLQKRHVAAYRRQAELERGGERASVEDLRRLGGGCAKQARQGLREPGPREVVDVVLELGVQIGLVPPGPVTSCGKGKCRRIPARGDPPGEFGTQPLAPSQDEAVAEQTIEEVRPDLLELALREGMKAEREKPSRQGIGEFRGGQDMG